MRFGIRKKMVKGHPNRAQSILEYAVLLCIILISLVSMQVFIRRCYQGRLKQQAETLGSQYSTGHTSSFTITSTKTTTNTYTGGKTHLGVAIPEGMTVTYSHTQTFLDRKEKSQEEMRILSPS